ncbi:MAG: DsrE family protein [Paludibacteraceae bacterium]|nr:DsrE family protein [Paludibacteraceae bacterium]MBR0502242.1 DsrE family protein [Paludibacteraceae bacterium]
MKKYLLAFLFVIASICSLSAQALRDNVKYNNPEEPKSIGIVLYSNDVETVYNAMRLAAYSQEWDNQVQIFLLGKGVELEKLMNENADIKQKVDEFIELGGVIMGCQTCFKSRQMDGTKICKVSCIQDLYDLVKKNQIVLTF